jgi:hypothetical protein
VLAVMVLIQRRCLNRRLATVMLAATLPMLALAAGERFAARTIHGDRLTSLMGRHLFAKAALIDVSPPPALWYAARRTALQHELDVTFAPIRDVIARAPRTLRVVLTLYYETCLQGPCVAEIGNARTDIEDPSLGDAMAEVGRHRIMQAPLNFMRLTAIDYLSLWTAYKQHHPDTAPALNAWIAANRPLPFEQQAFRLNPGDVPSFEPYPAVRFLQPIVLALGALTAALSLLALATSVTGRPLTLPVMAACIAALTANGGLLFSSLFAAGIARFIVALWPAITTAALLAGYAAFAGLQRRFGIAG